MLKTRNYVTLRDVRFEFSTFCVLYSDSSYHKIFQQISARSLSLTEHRENDFASQGSLKSSPLNRNMAARWL